jgi:calcineurin-like phosphoesterase family protein
MNLWFISDTHFGHENIIKYQNRPFAHAEDMDEAMIANWNKAVAPSDHIYHLGDVTMLRGGKPQQDKFCAIMARLNGHKRLLMGNHDHFPVEVYLRAGFEKIYGTWRGISNILLSHIPVHPHSLGTSCANVHGHIHANPAYPAVVWEDKHGRPHRTPYINISVEHTDYCPISLEDLTLRIRLAKENV